MTDGWSDEVQVYRSKLSLPSQRWRWRRVAANGRKLAMSSEGYADPAECAEMAARCCGDRTPIIWPQL